MAPTRSQPITFIVPGEEQQAAATSTRGVAPAPLPVDLPRGRVKQSVRVGAQRGGGGEVRMAAVPGEDVVVLEIANGPVLTLHPESARDLMLAQSATKKRGATTGKPGLAPDRAEVPVELHWDGLEEDGHGGSSSVRSSQGVPQDASRPGVSRGGNCSTAREVKDLCRNCVSNHIARHDISRLRVAPRAVLGHIATGRPCQ
jgi:hypothetical protein